MPDTLSEFGRLPAGAGPILESVGVLPFRWGAEGSLEVMMVTARADASRWIFPKGKMHRFFSGARSAAKEAYEEAGIRGTPMPRVVVSDYVAKGAGFQLVHYYLFRIEEVLPHWPEERERERLLVSCGEAADRIASRSLRAALLQLDHLIERHTAKPGRRKR